MKTIQWCAIEGDIGELTTLLKNNPSLRDARGSAFGHSILTLASAGGRVEIVELLLTRGADLYAQNGSKNNVLHVVIAELKRCKNLQVKENYYKIIRILLKHEATLNSDKTPLLEMKNKSGNTPLWILDSTIPDDQEIKDKILSIAKEIRTDIQREKTKQQDELHSRKLYSETLPKILKESQTQKERGCLAGFFHTFSFGSSKSAESENECCLLKIE